MILGPDHYLMQSSEDIIYDISFLVIEVMKKEQLLMLCKQYAKCLMTAVESAMVLLLKASEQGNVDLIFLIDDTMLLW